jgi:hypothetical protein
MIGLNQRAVKPDDSRQAPDVFPLTGKVIDKGNGDRESSNVSGGRIDGEAVGSTTFLGRGAATAHVTSGIVGVLDCTGDQVITALNVC